MYSDSVLNDSTVLDASGVGGASLDLFSPTGLAGHAMVAKAASERVGQPGCMAWPEVALVVEPGLADTGWTVALEAGRVKAIALDSLQGLTGIDSAQRTVEITRLVSALPGDTAAAYRGIPFFVKEASKFTSAGGIEVMVAKVSRRINQEANPREEQILLVAERDESRVGRPLIAAYHERVSGREESIESSDILAALQGSNGPTLVVIRDFGDGSVFSLLTRVAPAFWQIGWNSAYAGC
jgi:hypothetical protein